MRGASTEKWKGRRGFHSGYLLGLAAFLMAGPTYGSLVQEISQNFANWLLLCPRKEESHGWNISRGVGVMRGAGGAE